MKLFKSIILLIACNYIVFTTFAQANPFINVLPANSGLVSLGATLDLQITVGNTGIANIAASKLRPVISVPSIVNFLPDAEQTGLPTGWIIVPSSNTGSQIRICNGSDVIPGSTSRTIILKVRGLTIGGPLTFSGQMNFGGANCTVAGAPPSGNVTADDNATSSIQVVAGCNLGVTATAGTILCSGGTTTITAATTNATGAVEYSILRNTGPSVFQNSNIFNNETAGTYTVTVREVANPLTCVAITSSIIIIEPPALQSPVLSITQPTCSVATGTLTITSSTTGLTFSVDGGIYDSYTAAISLTTGTHTIQAKNGNDCLSPVTSITINPQPATPSIPLIGTITQPNCAVSTGAVVLSGLPSGDWTINPGNIAGNTVSTTLNNLPAGTYNYTVTNDVGCSSMPSATVTINAVLGAPTAPSVTVIQPTCTVSTGSIIVTSPTAGLTFSLDNGIYVSYPLGGFINISSGNHTLIVQNVSGCLSPFTNITINPQPASPAAAVVSVLQPTCTVSTGTIIVSSDTTGLTFSLDGGLFESYPAAGYTLVSTGTHNVRVQNTSGCIPSITNNIIVNVQPATPSASASASEITCFGSSSTLTVIGSGGVLPYEYSLNGNGTAQSINTFNNIVAGTYFVTVKDANGCTGTTSNVIIGQPTAIAASITTGSIACSGGTTTLTVLASGGSGALEYSLNNSPNFQASNIFNNVAAGSNSARVRPIANPVCITTTTTTILTQPDSLKATATALPINQCGGTSEVKVVASGGKLPYSGTGSFTKGPGKWTFLVTDANGCTTTSQVTILPPGCVYVRVFPNPAQNYITVNHSEALAESTIQIFGMNGALVLSKIVPQNSFITTIDISRLASETYLLVYISGNERKEMKFIKSNIK